MIRPSGRRPRSRWNLAALMAGRGAAIYDHLYRHGAPWEGEARPELVDLVTAGALTPSAPGPRVLDLSCGAGSASVYLAEHGFDVVGVDCSQVAIGKARSAGAEVGVFPTFVVGDLMCTPEASGGPFDVVIDGGTIDDFSPSRRHNVVERIERLSRPGSMLLTWCFYAWTRDLPLLSFSGPSRRGAPGIEPDELRTLFGKRWVIDQLSGGVDVGFACFLLTRR